MCCTFLAVLGGAKLPKPGGVSAPCTDEKYLRSCSLSLGMEEGSLLSSGYYATSINYLGQHLSDK